MQQRQGYPEFYRQFLNEQATQTLIQQAELRYEAERMGLTVSDQELQDGMRKGPYKEAFFPKGNWIGQQQYEKLLEQGGTTPEQFERDMKFELMMNKLIAAVGASAAVVPAEVERTYKDENLKVKFDYAIINAADVEKDIKSGDSDLKAFYDAQKARYQNSIPEKRQVKYFIIGDQQAQSKVTVTPADLQQYYTAHQEEYRHPDQVKVRHILVNTPPPGPDGKVDQKGVDAARAKAADLLKQIKSGADFAELAKKNSDDPGSKATGGELPGWYNKDSALVPEFKTAMFALNKGQTSDLVQTTYGFHIIQVVDKQPAHVSSLTEVKDQIEKFVREQKVSAALIQLGDAAEKDARSQGVDKAAAKYGVAALESNPISHGDALPGVGSSPELANAVFNVKEKDDPQAVHTPLGFVIFQVEKVVPPRTPSFDGIKDKVAADFKADRSEALLQKKAKELADRSHAEHDLRKVAKEMGAMVKTSDLVGRSSQVAELGSMAGRIGVALTMKQGEISQPIDAGKKMVVLEVVERQEPSLGDDFAKAKDGILEKLVNEKRQEAVQFFLSSLHDRLTKEGKIKSNTTEKEKLKGRG